MNVYINNDSEIWHEYKSKTIRDIHDLAFSIVSRIYESDEDRCDELHEIKDSLSAFACKSSSKFSQNRAECIFMLCAVSADLAITAFSALDQMAFECELENL